MWTIFAVQHGRKGREYLDKIKDFGQLPEALEYMAGQGIRNWRVVDAAVETMDLFASHLGKDYLIAHAR